MSEGCRPVPGLHPGPAPRYYDSSMIGLRAQAAGFVHRTGLPTRVAVLLLALLSLVMALLGFVAIIGDEDGNETPIPPDLDVTMWIVGGLGMLARVHRVHRARQTATTERRWTSTPSGPGEGRGVQLDAAGPESETGWARPTGRGIARPWSRTVRPGQFGRAFGW